jgi:propanol-preferring alcohol dehydrogenase
MRAMVLVRPGEPLQVRDVAVPVPGSGQFQVRVRACGVCRTDLHIADGELTHPALPLILGHEIVGEVTAVGSGASGVSLGQRVGVPWLGWTCGECRFCASGRENLCERARFTGYTLDGGYAEYAVVDARFCFPLPEGDAVAQAPLLCAGLIGFRALTLAGDARRIGLFGFGASAHLLAQVARHQGRRVFAFTREGDGAAQALARELGCEWAGASTQSPPEPLDAALIFAPVGALVPAALRAVEPGGVVVCAGIHMSDIPSFPYSLLWEERSVRSVANLTRDDARRFFAALPPGGVRTVTRTWPLDDANGALVALRSGKVSGAAVIVP